MHDNEYNNGELDSENMKKGIESDETTKLISTGNALVLALEDMIEQLGRNNEVRNMYGNNLLKYPNKSLSVSDIKDKTVQIGSKLKDFKNIIMIPSPTDEKVVEPYIESFLACSDRYVEEMLTEWIFKYDVEKAIDSTHNLCYKVREIVRKFEREH